VSRAPAPAKVNLALVVGPLRDDGKHEVLTVLQRIDLVDRIELQEARGLRVDGFAGDTLVGAALRELAERLGLKPRDAFQPIRLAVTGSKVSPGLFESLELLGREKALARLSAARS
jgi:glutamyl/glutaminyl-tRNA synthetase